MKDRTSSFSRRGPVGFRFRLRRLKGVGFGFLCFLATGLVIFALATLVVFVGRQALSPLFITKFRLDAESVKILDPIADEAYSIEILSIPADYDFEHSPLWVVASGKFDFYYRHHKRGNAKFDRAITLLEKHGNVKTFFNSMFFTAPDSIYPELAGILTALKGTLYTALLFMAFVCVFGVASGVYLSEFIKSEKIRRIFELNTNTLKGVPSIIYGLIGLGFLVGALDLPRSSGIVAGLTLGIMLLPFVITVTKQSIVLVPQALRDNARVFGATDTQVVFKVVLPSAFPNIVTGLLLAMMRGIGEASCLLLVGMVSYVQSPPTNLMDPTTTIPVQIYLWMNNPNDVFTEKTAALSLILILIVAMISVIASVMRLSLSFKTKR